MISISGKEWKEYKIPKRLIDQYSNDFGISENLSKFYLTRHFNKEDILIKKISETLKCGILLISHDLHVVMSATDHVVCLNGHVCCSGSPADVAQNKEYKELFGEKSSQLLSIYEHDHDHVHSPDRKIVKDIN